MKNDTAVKLLAALAQTSRLAVFRMLVQKGPDGLSAGEIAERLKMAPNALSFHLKELSHAGLVKSRQDGRFIYYSADYAAMTELVSFLGEKCCVGASTAQTCAPKTSMTKQRNAA